MEELTSVEITPSQRFISNLSAACGILLCGIFLLLAGIGVFGADNFVPLISPIILFSLSAIFLVTALVQKNVISLYLSCLLFVCGITSALANFEAGGATYANLYPMYVSAPIFASLVTMLMSRDYLFHLKIAFIFGVPSLLLFLISFNILAWEIGLPLLILFAGLCVLTAILMLRKGTKDK